MSEAYRTVELIEDSQGGLALQALVRHLDRMESRGQEPSGGYMAVHSINPHTDESVEMRWPVPMPKREDHIVLGYN